MVALIRKTDRLLPLLAEARASVHRPGERRMRRKLASGAPGGS